MVKIGGADYSTFTDDQRNFFIQSSMVVLKLQPQRQNIGSVDVNGGETHQVEKEVLL